MTNLPKLYYEVLGQGAPCLFLAGLASDSLSWTFQREALSAENRLILCDNRGVGRSPIPEHPYALEDMVGDVVELLDYLRLDQVSVVGHSMGGAIAQELALRHPHRVRRLVLVCSFLKVGERARRVLESWGLCLKEGVSPDLLARSLFPWLYSDKFFDQSGAFEAAQQALLAHPFPLNSQGIAGQLQALFSHNTTGRLGQVSCVTHVLGAGEDALVPLEESRALHQAIPGASLRILQGVGHSCMLEAPDLFNRELLQCLTT